MITKPRKQEQILFLSVVFFNFLFLMYLHVVDFYYDSSYYFSLGKVFFANEFSLQHYPLSIRECIYPLFLGILRKIGLVLFAHSFIFLRLSVAILFSCFVVYILPSLFDCPRSGKRYIIGSLLLTGLLWFFWQDIFQYPLSDFFALFLFSLALLCAKKLYGAHNLSLSKQLFLSFSLGFWIYATYNTRTIYLIPLLIVFGILVIKYIVKKLPNPFFAFLAAFFVGFALCSVPQIIVNWNHYNMITPKVFTAWSDEDLRNPNVPDLYAAQLSMGAQYLRCDGYVGDFSHNLKGKYPQAQILIQDRINQARFSSSGFSSVSEYLQYIFKNPILFLSLYVRHFLSGTIWYFSQSVYITDLRFDYLRYMLNLILYLLAIVGGFVQYRTPPNLMS